jgi:hypothetical protein
MAARRPQQTNASRRWAKAGDEATRLQDEAMRQRFGLPARFKLPQGFSQA